MKAPLKLGMELAWLSKAMNSNLLFSVSDTIGEIPHASFLNRICKTRRFIHYPGRRQYIRYIAYAPVLTENPSLLEFSLGLILNYPWAPSSKISGHSVC